MAARYQFYQGQFVESSDLNDAFAGLESADQALANDLGFLGVVIGGGLSQAVIPNLSVVLQATVAYDQLGQRCYVPASIVIDCSVDYLGVSTAVAVSGHKKILSVFIQFARAPSDPRTDTETPPQTIFYNQAESYKILVYQGAEGVAPAPPPLLSNAILLGDITLSNTGGTSQIQIHTDGVPTGGSQGFYPANVPGHDVAQRGCGDQTVPGNVAAARSQILFAIAHATTWPGINTVSIHDALTAISAELDAVTASGVLNYLGSNLTPNVTGAWADGSFLAPELTLGDALSDAVRVLGLSTNGAGASGAYKIGVGQIPSTTGGVLIPASGVSGLYGTLTALKSANNLDYSSPDGWANGDTVSTTGDLAGYLHWIIQGLAVNHGTSHIAGDALPSLTGGTPVGLDNLYNQLLALKQHDANLDAQAVVGTQFNLAAGSVESQFQEVANLAVAVAKLAAQVNPTGETMVGGRALSAAAGATFALAAGTLEARLQSVLDQLAQETAGGTNAGETHIGGQQLTGAALFNTTGGYTTPLAAGPLETRIQRIIDNAAPRVDTHEYTANDTWTPPPWILPTSVVDIEVIGAGGGGGGGEYTNSSAAVQGGGGGGAGGRSRRTVTYADLGSPLSLPVVVGTPGTGGAGGGVFSHPGVSGTGGGDTSVGNIVARGGAFGAGGGVPGGAGGAGGAGDFPGGDGGNAVVAAAGASGGSSGAPGGGGGGGSCNSMGVDYAGGVGGADAANTAAAATAGASGGSVGGAANPTTPTGPGGGGGGGGGNAGGAGGDGGASANYGGGGGGGGAGRTGAGGHGADASGGYARVTTRY